MSDVLKNRSQVKLQRNALSVLEHHIWNEVDDDNDFDTSSGSNIGKYDFYRQRIP
jgi:PHYB activation tagged suppressor 1